MVRIVVLNDNRKNNPQLENEHGLSLYIEVDGYKILLDAGQTDIFKKNAKNVFAIYMIPDDLERAKYNRIKSWTL